jgi:hypothetical protein
MSPVKLYYTALILTLYPAGLGEGALRYGIMINYYILPESRSQAFLIERRMKGEGILCEIAFIPRDISFSPCNMGVKFGETQCWMAIDLLKRSGLPGCMLYKEVVSARECLYYKIEL